MDRKVDFTAAEIETFIEMTFTESDIVRVVDPASQRVCRSTITGDSERLCSDVWGRDNRCENCTSLRALQSKGIAYKMEVLADQTFWVMSRYVRVDGEPFILEVVMDITDNLLMDSDQLNDIGVLIGNYNHQLITDALTDIYNRRFLDESFLPSLACCHDPNLTLNLAIMDLDDFKHVNDTFGHQAGDALLKDVAGFWHRRFDSRVKGRERLTVRYGGDEMLLIACGTTRAEFEDEVSRCYAQMRKVCYYTPQTMIPFSITFGIASSEELGPDWDWGELFDLTDRRLYANKIS